MSDNPYGPKPPPPDRQPDPAQASHVLSSRCLGYQTHDHTPSGIITNTVRSGRVKFDGDRGGDGVERFWTDGTREYLETPPRIDRAVAAWPHGT